MEPKPPELVQRPDANSQKSQRRGLSAVFENGLRQFQILAHLCLVAPLYFIGSLCLGLALVPGVVLFQSLQERTQSMAPALRVWILGSSLGAGYFLYGFSLLFILPSLNFAFRSNLDSWRGPYYSIPAIKWYIHNGLTYLMRYTFLEFITPTPMNLFFYQMMGMKIGKGTIINSTHISDPSIIELGEKVTLGGSVTIVGHYGQGGFLVLAPVKIGNRVTIGLKAIVMGGAQIGDDAKVLPGSVVLPKTVIPSGQTWGGVPAQPINVGELKAELKKVS